MKTKELLKKIANLTYSLDKDDHYDVWLCVEEWLLTGKTEGSGCQLVNSLVTAIIQMIEQAEE